MNNYSNSRVFDLICDSKSFYKGNESHFNPSLWNDLLNLKINANCYLYKEIFGKIDVSFTFLVSERLSSFKMPLPKEALDSFKQTSLRQYIIFQI